MPSDSSRAGTAAPAGSRSSIRPGASATLRGSSGCENTSRIVELSNIGRNDAGWSGGPPLTATRAAAAVLGRVVRVVKRNSGPLAGRLPAAGASAEPAYTAYIVPSASAAVSCTILPSPTTAVFAATGPSGPTRHSAPTGCAAVPEHAAIALMTTGSENVTTMRAPVGTSSWPSAGNV